MAAFDDQFERHDPLTLKFDAPSESWPRRIAFEAQTVLSAAARAEVTRIAFAIDALISSRAIQATRLATHGGGSAAEVEQEFRSRRSAIARQLYGDVALFAAGGGVDAALRVLKPVSATLTEADMYAVLALWKLIDYLDLKASPKLARRHAQFAWVSIEKATAIQPSAGRAEATSRTLENALAEAAHASATAWQIAQNQMRVSGLHERADSVSRGRDDLIEAGERAVKDSNTTRARAAANAQHDKPGGSRDKRAKIRACWASGKYSSRDRCAEEECAALGMSLATARKALRNTPDPA